MSNQATYSLETKTAIRPVIKWVGGKRQIEDVIFELAPKDFEQYFEPFSGGAAIFFKLIREGKISAAVISDYNPQLALTYTTLSNDVEAVISLLESPEFENSEENYYRVRALDRSDSWPQWMKDKENFPRVAARVIFLTKLSFNGLWRENKKGQHNAPYCKDSNKSTFNAENLRAVAKALKGIIIGRASYKYLHIDNWQHLACNQMPICPTDFFYFDPPYVQTFVGYTGNGFNWSDLVELREIIDNLTELGAYTMLSMKDSPEIRELFKGYRIIEIQTHCRINCDASKRKNGMSEVIIMNYDKNDRVLKEVS